MSTGSQSASGSADFSVNTSQTFSISRSFPSSIIFSATSSMSLTLSSTSETSNSSPSSLSSTTQSSTMPTISPTSSTATSTSTTSTSSTSSSTTSTSTTSSSSTSSSSTFITSTSSTATSSTTSTTLSSIIISVPHPPPSTTTFRTPVFVTTTDSRGSQTTTAPIVITSTFVATKGDGSITTITEIGVNPTLSPDNGASQSPSFFRNRGAVAGVFVLIGLAAASIVLWVVFATRRRRRTQQMEHETAISDRLAAAGFHRAPLDDGDDDIEVGGSKLEPSVIEMTNRSSSGFGMSLSQNPGRPPSGIYDHEEYFNPYTDYIVPSGSGDAYIPARTTSPVPDGTTNDPRRMGHSATASAASSEPLLSARHRTASYSPPSYSALLPSAVPPSPPPRNPLRLTDNPHRLHATPGLDRENSGGPSSEEAGDDRLDPGLRNRLRSGTSGSAVSRELRDEEDYSRPVLGVRNLPDTRS